MSQIKIALIQMRVSSTVEENLSKSIGMIEEASQRGARIVMLPEMFVSPFDTDLMKERAEYLDGRIISLFKETALKFKVNILAGSIPEKRENDMFSNTSVFIGYNGEILAAHRKLHLYDVDLGEISVKESDVFITGEEITVFDTEFARCGIAICYDIRFPEIFQIMAKEGAQIVFIPAFFNRISGEAHWETLVRSRAIDNQVFIAACSPASDKNLKYNPWGHSMIVDPWGKIIAASKDKEEIIYSVIDLNRIKEVREKLPLDKHRRDDIY